MVPKTLADWSYDHVVRLCAAGQSESDRHDFKLGLTDPVNLTKLSCAFANSFGGFVIVGVKDKKGFDPVGIDPDSELYGTFLAKVRASPDIPIPPPAFLSVPNSVRLIYIFEVLQSPRRPHLPTAEDQRVFWKRVGPSCVQMTLEEIRAQMSVYEEKREKLALLLIDLSNKRKAVFDETEAMPGAFTGTIYSFDMIDRIVVESFSLLKADLETIKLLDTLRGRFELLNASKQHVIAMQSTNSTPHHKRQVADQHRGLVLSNQHEIGIAISKIERSIGQKFGIENPYRASA